MTPQRMKLKDAAASYGISTTQLLDAIHKDELPGIMYRSRWTVRPTDVDAWLAAHGTPNGAEQERAS